MGLRLLLLLILVVLIYRWASFALKNLLTPQALGREPREMPPVKLGRLVACSVCGVHVVESQALLGGGAGGTAVLCSEACRERARATS